MVRLLKRFCWVWLMMAGASSAFAFSLLGPINEPYQVNTIGYDLNLLADLGAPKNLGEEYRRNTPVMYYSFDQNFLDYFGSNGVYAVEQAFAILNGLTNVSTYGNDLPEFPLEATRYNYRAQALGLFDIKTFTLNLLAEQLGLAEPERYIWALHDRFQPAGTTCPNGTEYLVIKRNFDPVTSTLDQLQPSSYVNGTLYSYFISEYCTANASPIPPMLADADEFAVDPLADTFTAVASRPIYTIGHSPLSYGGFFTGLTRDDVAGLRYLMRANNLNIETAGANTLTITTNLNTSSLLFSSNLTLLVAQSLTNDAAPLVALNPGLVVTRTTPIFTNVITTNTFFVFTNSPYDPVGMPARLVPVTVRTTNAFSWFRHEFANVFTNRYVTNGLVTVFTTNISTAACGPYYPAGTICTNISTNTVVTNMIQGDYYLVPFTTNTCGVAIISTQLIQTLYFTNAPLVATNAPGTTNVANQQFSQNTVYSWNQYVFVVHPVVCQTNSVALRQGIERITFVRRDYDSLLGDFFNPVTNEYVLNAVTNNTLTPQRARRVLNQPDILFSADDLAAGPGAVPNAVAIARNIQFGTNTGAYPGLAGPGTIETPTTFIFNKVGPIFFNTGTAFLDEASQFLIFLWGSFDGTTNPPVVFPNGTTIANLENQVLIQVSPSGPLSNGVVQLPNGTVDVDYANDFGGFTAIGGQPPYTWAMAPGSPALPPNLTLNADGTISGAPANSTAGLTFDFVIRVSDVGARFVDRNYAITINP